MSRKPVLNFSHFANFYVQMCRSSVNATKQVSCVYTEGEVCAHINARAQACLPCGLLCVNWCSVEDKMGSSGSKQFHLISFHPCDCVLQVLEPWMRSISWKSAQRFGSTPDTLNPSKPDPCLPRLYFLLLLFSFFITASLLIYHLSLALPLNYLHPFLLSFKWLCSPPIHAGPVELLCSVIFF